MFDYSDEVITLKMGHFAHSIEAQFDNYSFCAALNWNRHFEEEDDMRKRIKTKTNENYRRIHQQNSLDHN